MPKKKVQNLSSSTVQNSLIQLADQLASSTKEVMRTAKTEEELRIGFEKLLDPILKILSPHILSRYEHLSAQAKIVYRGRPDAVHGQVIIEYESPKSFSAKYKIEHAYDQLVEYLTAESKNSDLKKPVGVGFDGESIFFVQYQGQKNQPIDQAQFARRGPYPFDAQSALTFLVHLRALSRLPLTAEHLSIKFGPDSELAAGAVSAFADAWENWGNEKTRVFFNEWKRLFGIVYGEPFAVHQEKEAEILAKLYNVGKETDFQKLLFSVHTYFAFLMKLISVELLTLQDVSFSSSFMSDLIYDVKETLIRKLTDIEDGGIYARQGITNFLEGDFFRWYLDAWSPRLEEVIRKIARTLSEFEPATSMLDPETTRDLLKKLYQYLVPQEVRHRLGEYYTPDWLAELVLKEVGYDGNTLKRVLDPACGSGTFLVLAIRKAREHGQKERLPPLEIAKRIVNNIMGFDLNPLAIIASRTNYLFALGDLIYKLKGFEIPIYLTDSVLWPKRTGQPQFNFYGGDNIPIPTSVKTFHVPYIWIKDGKFLLRKAASLIELMAKNKIEPETAIEHFKKEGLVFPPHEKVVGNFYTEILELEKQNKNGIWARFLKNAFAPMMAEKFDFVVGNPPWIRWGYLSQEYRQATLELWINYGLFSLKGHAARLGGGEKDFSMLFTYAAADYYLKDSAKLGFLITQEVFKSKGAGEGFRRFRLGEKGKPFKVLKAHDFVTVQPFEKAANKTAFIILAKGKETSYPLPYVLWRRRKGIGKIPTDFVLDQVLPLLQRNTLIAQPVSGNTGSWQTLSKRKENVLWHRNHNAYQARRGASTEPYGVFWLEIKQILSGGNLIVRNLPEKGKREIPSLETTIESDLVYPAIRGADIQRWGTKPEIYILMTQYPKIREPYPENVVKKQWPRTFGYLTQFKNALLTRGSKTVRTFAEKTAFYAMYGIGPYTMASYKVVWKRMANDLVSTVVSQYKTLFGYKMLIPTDTTAFFPVNNESEAHYLCAILNSIPVREFIKSYSSAGRGFGAPSVMQHVGIPKFDPKNKVHQALSDISKQCHHLKTIGKEDEIPPLEEQNDNWVKRLFKIQ